MHFWKVFVFLKILKFRSQCWVSKKSIYCLIINRTKSFCQNFFILIRKQLDLNFGTKFVEIHLKLCEIYYFEAKNSKFYKSNFEDYGAVFRNYVSHIVFPYLTP